MNENKTMQVRIHKDHYDRIKEKADRFGININAMTNMALFDWLEERDYSSYPEEQREQLEKLDRAKRMIMDL